MKFPFFRRQNPEKKFKSILENYKKAAEQNPGDIRIHVKIAELYLENNKKPKAIEEYIYAARAYQRKRLFQIAIAIYKHVISVFPDQVDAYLELSDLHIKNGFIGDCVAVLEKLANYYYDNKMRYEATNVLKKISRIDPENKFFKIKVAKFIENKDLSEEETLKEGPKDKWELKEEKNHAKLKEDSSEGFFDLEAVLHDDVSIHISTHSAEEENKISEPPGEGLTPDSVFEKLKTIMETEPDQDNPQFHYSLGLAYQRCNQIEEAMDEFKKALDGSENPAECSIKLAECNILLNRLDEAMDCVKKGLKIDFLTDTEKLDLDYLSGLIFKAKGDTAKALDVFKRIYDADKNFKSVEMEIKKLSQQ
jgi:tetratricopeptide (TPR) repeat protein